VTLAREPRRAATFAALVCCVLTLTACGGGATPASSRGHAASEIKPEHIVPAPKNLLSAAQPQPNGTMWMLAGSTASRGLYEVDLSDGQMIGSVSVSNAARSVAQSLTGMIGLALGTRRTGALELLDGRTAKVVRTVPLPAPAREVVVGSDDNTFYVLNGTPAASSVSAVDSRTGRLRGTVPVPADAVSFSPGAQQSTLYVLGSDGRVSEISMVSRRVMASFAVGDSGRSLAFSPDGSTLYALKGSAAAANVAVVNVARESVLRALPAPSNCLEVILSASGRQLYEVVGTAGYGNVQIFAA
jgi:DNA-binding beta-propeller fold protein YncE